MHINVPYSRERPSYNSYEHDENEPSMPLSTNPAELTRRDGAEKKRTVLVVLAYAMRWFNMSLGT
jgi:hypothetical protein